MISISKTNKKMGAIPSISFPPVVTCANCSQCQKKCYAKKMMRLHKNVEIAWKNNLKEWEENPDAVKYAILSNAVISGYFRYFVGGDIPNANFFAVMVEIAKIAKNCKFLAFTKKYNIINDYILDGGVIPQNLQIIFSGWGDDLKPCNPFNLPKSDIILKGKEAPQGAKVCGGNCYECICRGVACWELNHGETIYFYEH